MLSCKSWMFVKENPDRKKRKFAQGAHILQSDDRSENDRGYKNCKFVHGSYYWWRYFQLIERCKNDRAYRISKFINGIYYWWTFFQLGDRNRNDRAYKIFKSMLGMCINSFQKRFFSFLLLTLKRNAQWKITKEKPVWNKLATSIRG